VKDIRLKPVLIITPYTYPTRKKIAVVTNQSGVVLIEDNKENLADNKMQTHLVDFAQKISILKIFAPEHGFRGTLTLLSTEWILQLDYRLFRFI
jgi:hypothetical protein